MFRYCILGLLQDKSMTGYDLKKKIDNGVGVFSSASFGSIYPTLAKLAQDGLVDVQQEQDGHHKKLYTITDDGRQYFMEWLAQPIDVQDTTQHQLMRLYFYDGLPEKQRKGNLAQYEQDWHAYMQKLHSIKAQLDTEENRREHYFKLSTLYYGLYKAEATLGWCGLLQGQLPFDEKEDYPHAD